MYSLRVRLLLLDFITVFILKSYYCITRLVFGQFSYFCVSPTTYSDQALTCLTSCFLHFSGRLFHQKQSRKNQSDKVPHWGGPAEFQHSLLLRNPEVLILTALRHPPFKDVDRKMNLRQERGVSEQLCLRCEQAESFFREGSIAANSAAAHNLLLPPASWPEQT